MTASRFGEPDLATSSNVMVITREEIDATGAQTVPDALARLAGAGVQALFGSLGVNTSIDMRGFGEGAAQRTLVLLDGLRLNPLDTSAIDWGLVPLDAIDRIEVISGSAAVLYGDNAVGGVINIITDRQRSGASVRAGVGGRNASSLSASVGQQQNRSFITLSAHTQKTDGWRVNNRQQRTGAAGRLGVTLDRGEAFIAFGASETHAGLPGQLTRAQYRLNPRQAETEDSLTDQSSLYVRPGLRLRLGHGMDFAMEAGIDNRHVSSWISNWFSFRSLETTTVSVTPRLQWRHRLWDLHHRTVFGFDHYDGSLANDQSASLRGPIAKTVSIHQLSEGVYVQNQSTIADGLTLTVGGRRQQVGQSLGDSQGASGAQRFDRHVGDIGLNWRADPGVRFFARTGSTFRFANLDDLTTFQGFAGTPVRPERGAYLDVGLQLGGKRHSVMATAYRLDMIDEIIWNLAAGQNENLSRTRRHGVELSSRFDLSAQWALQAGAALVDARFSEGASDGRRVPLVPRYRLTAGVTLSPIQPLSISLLANHVARRYELGDNANTQEPLEAHTTLDVVSTLRVEAWSVRGRIKNLTDRRYALFGGYGGVYPADGRAVFVDLRRDF